MKPTDQTLIEQMRISEIEIETRKKLFSFTELDTEVMKKAQPYLDDSLDALVSEFYNMQTSIPEIAILIGDADTLTRLRNAQRRYITDLFSGVYDIEYVNNRLRIGLVHKRIGVEPKLYLSAMHTLKTLIQKFIIDVIEDQSERNAIQTAIEKLLHFDVTLVFETYIRSLVSEIEISKIKSDNYAQALEEKVKERTLLLEEMTRIDHLTGLLNIRHLNETMTTTIRAAQRRSEPVSVVFIDINDFKIINDTQGHLKGDEIIRAVANTIKRISRAEDSCFRYGGDEFCIIMPNCTEEQAREIYISRLNTALTEIIDDISLSSGIIQTGPHVYASPIELIREADEKMYAIKKSTKSEQIMQL